MLIVDDELKSRIFAFIAASRSPSGCVVIIRYVGLRKIRNRMLCGELLSVSSLERSWGGRGGRTNARTNVLVKDINYRFIFTFIDGCLFFHFAIIQCCACAHSIKRDTRPVDFLAPHHHQPTTLPVVRVSHWICVQFTYDDDDGNVNFLRCLLFGFN